jgi:hypothetical protein
MACVSGDDPARRAATLDQQLETGMKLLPLGETLDRDSDQNRAGAKMMWTVSGGQS